MGIAVSDWRLAHAVSSRGQLGVVSGTAIDSVFVRRLQDGDPGGHVRRAMAAFPMPGVVEHVLTRWFRPEGRAAGEKYRELPMYKQVVNKLRQQTTMLAMFVEVWLAKEGHGNPVGVNLLTKIQLPNALPYIFSGMKVAAILAVAGAIVGEFLGSDRGLGYLMLQVQVTLDTAAMFMAVILITLIGMVLYGIVLGLERLLVVRDARIQ